MTRREGEIRWGWLLLFSAPISGGEQEVRLLIMRSITDGYQMVDHLIKPTVGG
jgi:hypothetical protein